MPRLFPFYPDGAPGIALLLIRLACALIAYPALDRSLPPSLEGWPSVFAFSLMILAFIGGIATRAAALLLLAALCAALVASSREFAFFILASVASAAGLALLGPGAYSIDAHRFGRRVIRLDPRSPNRGGPD
jgi:putative oxidoreductase